jgi:dynein heavy chain
MLSVLSREEDPSLEEEKIRLMAESQENKRNLEKVETNILNLLRDTPGS